MNKPIFKTYYQNGTYDELYYILPEELGFAVQVLNFQEVDQITLFYRNDYLVREIDLELINLYDVFVDMYFKNHDLYNFEQELIPIGIAYGGFDSRSSIAKEQLISLISSNVTKIKDINRHIYVYDCHYLISTLQNLVLAAEYYFTQFYISLSDYNVPQDMLQRDNVLIQTSDKTIYLQSIVETFFIKSYSILDILVKIIIELDNPVTDFSTMRKLVSSEKLWGYRKNLSINGTKETVFEDSYIIRTIESLRNEAVHNGSWELRPSIYFDVSNGVIKERYMLFPDLENGRLSTIKNRKHFFSKNSKINDILVDIHDDFYKRLLFTLRYINDMQHRII